MVQLISLSNYIVSLHNNKIIHLPSQTMKLRAYIKHFYVNEKYEVLYSGLPATINL